jgi:hypothetical protein
MSIGMAGLVGKACNRADRGPPPGGTNVAAGDSGIVLKEDSMIVSARHKHSWREG